MSDLILAKPTAQLPEQSKVSKPIDWFRTLLISFTAILFIVTGAVQNSCYPMVTAGSLNKVCKNRIEEIVKDSRTHGNVLINLLADPDLDEDNIRVLATNLDRPQVSIDRQAIRAALAYHPHTPADILAELTQSDDPIVIAQIASRPNATNDVFQKVVNHPAFKTFAVRAALVNNPQAPNQILAVVASNSNEIEIQTALATNPQVTENVLQQLARVEDFGLLQLVIRNSNTSSKVLDIIGENSLTWEPKYAYLQQSLAKREQISPQLAWKLVGKSNNSSVLYALQENSSDRITQDIRKKVTDRLMNDRENTSISRIEPPNSVATISPPPTKCQDRHELNNTLGVFGGVASTLAAIAIVNPIAIPIEVPVLVGIGAYSLVTAGLELFHHC
jgi:hypothetical protein